MPPSVLAFCPSPPLLVPELASGAAAETDALRAACDRAVGVLRAAVGSSGSVVVLSAGPCSRVLPPDAAGSLAGLGSPVTVGGGGPRVLSLGSTLGAWLLARAGATAAAYVEVGADADADPGPEGVQRLAAADGLLVVGDGTACLGARGPGGERPEAAAYDEQVVAALASADPHLLTGLDLAVGRDLLAAGVPPWVAAGRAVSAGSGMRATLVRHEAPYGVSYIVATWTSGDIG